MRKSIFVLLLLATVACQSHAFNGTEVDRPAAAPDFELQNVAGGTFSPRDMPNTVLLLYFGYTSCPDVCPATLAQARQLFDLLGEEAVRVRFLFITVDPARDTPPVMRTYIEVFHPNIIGLTGSPDQLADVFDAYGIVAEKVDLPESAIGYTMNHTTRLFVIDAQGRLRLSFGFGTPADEMAADIAYLLE